MDEWMYQGFWKFETVSDDPTSSKPLESKGKIFYCIWLSHKLELV